MASANQPKTYDVIKIPVVIPALAGLIIALPLFFLGIDRYAVASAGITVFAFMNGGIAFKQLNEISSIDNALPRFLRDITEYRKMGYDLVNAMIIASEENKYGKYFDRHLSYIASQLKLGRPMNDIIREVKMRSYLEKLSFNLVATGIEEGEIKPSQLEILIDFITTVNRVKKETKAKLRLNTLISFMAPIGLILTTYLIAGVMTYFTSTTGMLGMTNQTLPAGQLSGYKFASQSGVNLLMKSSKAMMISSSLGIGLLAGKISDFTAKSTIKLAIIMAITVVSLLFGGVMTSMFMKALMGGMGG
jgi:flagellar protein FlaJ